MQWHYHLANCSSNPRQAAFSSPEEVQPPKHLTTQTAQVTWPWKNSIASKVTSPTVAQGAQCNFRNCNSHSSQAAFSMTTLAECQQEIFFQQFMKCLNASWSQKNEKWCSASIWWNAPPKFCKLSSLFLQAQGESHMLANRGTALVKEEPKSLDCILASLKTDFTLLSPWKQQQTSHIFFPASSGRFSVLLLVYSCVQETCKCGTEGHGLVGSVGGRWMDGLDDSNFNDSMILFLHWAEGLFPWFEATSQDYLHLTDMEVPVIPEAVNSRSWWSCKWVSKLYFCLSLATISVWLRKACLTLLNSAAFPNPWGTWCLGRRVAY